MKFSKYVRGRPVWQWANEKTRKRKLHTPSPLESTKSAPNDLELLNGCERIIIGISRISTFMVCNNEYLGDIHAIMDNGI